MAFDLFTRLPKVLNAKLAPLRLAPGLTLNHGPGQAPGGGGQTRTFRPEGGGSRTHLLKEKSSRFLRRSRWKTNRARNWHCVLWPIFQTASVWKCNCWPFFSSPPSQSGGRPAPYRRKESLECLMWAGGQRAAVVMPAPPALPHALVRDLRITFRRVVPANLCLVSEDPRFAAGGPDRCGAARRRWAAVVVPRSVSGTGVRRTKGWAHRLASWSRGRLQRS